jgi:hypothetical protein
MPEKKKRSTARETPAKVVAEGKTSGAGTRKKKRLTVRQRRVKLVAAVKAAQQAVDRLPVGKPGSRAHSELRDADRSLRMARSRLAAHDARYGKPKYAKGKRKRGAAVGGVPGAPAGLITSGVGMVRIRGQRIVGDSQANYRSHRAFRK